MVETAKGALADLCVGKVFPVIVVSAKAAADAKVFRAEASFQMHARGALGLPVETQAQVSRPGLRIAERTRFMVPPCAGRAGTPGASARGRGLAGAARIIGSGGCESGLLTTTGSRAQITGRMLG